MQFRIDAGPGQYGLDGCGGKVLDGHIAQASAERAHRRAHRRHDRGSAVVMVFSFSRAALWSG